MGPKDRMVTKYGLIVQELAKRIIRLEENDRLPTVGDLARVFDAGRGTVQEALRILKESGAVKLSSHGRLGTFVIEKDEKRLISMTGIKHFFSAMALPYTTKYEGLATGLSQGFRQNGFSLSFYFTHEPEERLEAVRSGMIDFAVVSQYTAKAYRKKRKIYQEKLSMGPESFVSMHTVFLSDPEANSLRPGMRVGLDATSVSQRDTTHAECDHLGVVYVEDDFRKLLEMLSKRELDAFIWNRDEIQQKNLIFKGIPLRSPKAQRIVEALGEAVCVFLSDNVVIEKILDMISVEEISKIQKQVEQNQLQPRY